MKKLFLLLLFIVLLFSCSRESDTDNAKSNYYLKGIFNGEAKSFNFLYYYGGGRDSSQREFIQIMYLLSEKADYYPAMVLDIVPKNDGAALTPGTYTEENSYVKFEYRQNSNDYDTSAKYAPKDFQFTITEIGNKKIRGTFSGTLQNTAGQITIVKNGEFYGYAN